MVVSEKINFQVTKLVKNSEYYLKFLPNIPHQYIYQGDSYPPSPPQIIYLFL